MKILCKIKEDATKKNSGWENVTLVAPLSVGNYLDKQLDERYISFYSGKEIYRVGAIVGIGYKKDGQPLTEWEYFILGRDSSAQSSFKKGVYFHQDAFLLEATKYLEGILCQSITFTNKLGQGVIPRAIAPKSIQLANVPGAPRKDLNKKQMIALMLVTTPAAKGTKMKLPSVSAVCQAIGENRDSNTYHEAKPAYVVLDGNDNPVAYPYIEIETADKTTKYEVNAENCNTEFEYTVTKTAMIRYRVFVSMRDGTGWTVFQYAFEYQQIAVETRQSGEPWTVATVVDRILDLAEPLFAVGSGKPTPRFYLSGSGKFAEYAKTIAPEFTLTECNLREQLQTVGGFIHAEPRATYDPNENAFRISFDDYGDPGEADLSGASLIERHGSMDISQYATEVKSNAQNLVNSLGYGSGTVDDPAFDFYRSVRSENIYARITDKNARVYTQSPIYSIEKVVVGLLNYESTTETWKIEPVDITNFIYEKTEYDANLSSYEDGISTSKEYAVYYTQGRSGLDGLFYQIPNAKDDAVYSPYAISNILAICSGRGIDEVDKLFTDAKNAEKAVGSLAFRITYKPIFAATVSHSKNKYDPTLPKWQQVYNQSGNMIETTYYGENLKMTAAMLGNPEEERTYLLPPQARLPGVGKRLDNFAISAVKAEIYPRYTKATLALTRDFERISEFVGIDSVKRVYEVSEKEVYNRNVFLKSYIVIGKKPSQIPTANIGVDMEYLGHSFYAPNSTDENTVFLPVSCVKVKGKSNHQTYPAVQIPVIASSFGNSMEFSFCMKDNYSAGDKAMYISATDGVENVRGYWLTDVPYGDAYGRIEYLDATFLQKSSDDAHAYYTTPETKFDGTYFGDVLKFNKSYYIRKDSREKITVSVSVEFRAADEKLIIGSALATRSTLVSREEPQDCFVGILKSPINKSVSYIASDNIVASEKLGVGFQSDSFSLQTRPDVSPAPASGAGWVIYRTLPKKTVIVVTENGSQKTVTYGGENEVLLAYNRPIQKGESMFHDGSTPLFCFYQVNA